MWCDICFREVVKEMKVLFIWDIAGFGARIAQHINSNDLGKAYVIHREQFDPFYITREFEYNVVPRCSIKKFILIVIIHLLRFRPNIVHINSWSKGIFLVKMFAPRSKLVFQFHGSDLRGKTIPWFVKFFSKIILVSTKDLIRKDTMYLGVPQGV